MNNRNGTNSNGVALVPAVTVDVSKEDSLNAFKDSLVEGYFDGKNGLSEKLESAGKIDIESLMMALIDEMVAESDSLLGSRLVASNDGDLQAATVISYKRAQVLEKIVKSAHAKQQFERDTGVDLDSPSMMVVFRFFMGKVKAVFDQTGMTMEQSDVFFRTLGEEMEDWKKELQEEFRVLKSA